MCVILTQTASCPITRTEVIANFWTDIRRRVPAWFDDDVFRRLFVNAGKLLSANAVAAGLGLVTTVLTARALGPQNYGILALVLVYQLSVGRLVTFNAWQAIIKFGSETLHADDRIGLRQLVKFGFTLDIVSALVGTVLAMALAGPVVGLLGWDPSVRPLLVLYSVLILFSLSGTPIGVLRLFNRFDLLSYTAVLGAVARLAGVAWCLLTRQALYGFVLIYLITGAIGELYQLVASLWVLRKQNVSGIIHQPMREIRGRFPGIVDYVWTTNVNSTIRMMSREADELVIAALTTPVALGIFKVAKQFAQVLPRFLDPLYQSIYPELTRLWAADRRKAFLSLIERTTLLVGGVATVGWIGFILLGSPLITWTVGAAYSQAYVPAVVYLLALVMALWAFALQPAMLAVGMPRNSFKAQAAATTLYFVILLPAVQSLGVTGAAVAYVLYYLLWAVLMMCFLCPHLRASPACA